MSSSEIKELKKRAKGGDIHSVSQLGVFYLLGHQVSRDLERGFSHIKQAAEGGEIASQTLLATLYATGMGVEEDWEKAYDWLVAGAQNGDPKAIDQITYFIPEVRTKDHGLTWKDVRNRLSRYTDYDINDYLVHHTQPLIRTQENFLDQRTCDYVMKAAKPYLNRADVNDSTGGAKIDPSRTNSAMSFFPLENDLVMQTINKKIAAFTGHPHCHGEPSSVLHYEVGQQYHTHFDYFNPDFPAHVPHLKKGGQRIKTFLIYLNEDFEGGETSFPNLDWKYKGKAGEAILFDNVTSKGEIIENSLHAGLAPTRGEKWIFSKWLRDQPQY